MNDDAGSDAVIDLAFRALWERAAQIRLREHRDAFLTRNEEVRTILEIARSRLSLTLPPFPDFNESRASKPSL